MNELWWLDEGTMCPYRADFASDSWEASHHLPRTCLLLFVAGPMWFWLPSSPSP